MENAETGHQLAVDLEVGQIRYLTIGRGYQPQPYPPFMMEIIDAGGLVPHTRQNLALPKPERQEGSP